MVSNRHWGTKIGNSKESTTLTDSVAFVNGAWTFFLDERFPLLYLHKALNSIQHSVQGAPARVYSSKHSKKSLMAKRHRRAPKWHSHWLLQILSCVSSDWITATEPGTEDCNANVSNLDLIPPSQQFLGGWLALSRACITESTMVPRSAFSVWFIEVICTTRDVDTRKVELGCLITDIHKRGSYPTDSPCSYKIVHL